MQTDNTTRKADRHSPATYEIRLQGHLDGRWREQLELDHLSHGPGGATVLRATADQPALHALLHRIRDLGLPLISVTRLDPTP